MVLVGIFPCSGGSNAPRRTLGRPLRTQESVAYRSWALRSRIRSLCVLDVCWRVLRSPGSSWLGRVWGDRDGDLSTHCAVQQGRTTESGRGLGGSKFPGTSYRPYP